MILDVRRVFIGAAPVPENREKVLRKLCDLGKIYEKNPCAETAPDYHNALDAARAAVFEDLPASPMRAAYDAQKPADRSPAGVSEKHQK